MFPTSFAEWTALVATLIPLVIWAGSGLAKAMTSRAEQRAAEWLRLQQLAIILYNADHSFGGWAQQLAATELLELAKHNRAAADLAKTIITFWEQPEQSSPAALKLVTQLRGKLR